MVFVVVINRPKDFSEGVFFGYFAISPIDQVAAFSLIALWTLGYLFHFACINIYFLQFLKERFLIPALRTRIMDLETWWLFFLGFPAEFPDFYFSRFPRVGRAPHPPVFFCQLCEFFVKSPG